MSQLEQQDGLVPNATNMKPPLFESSESRAHTINNNDNAQGESANINSANHHAISMGASPLWSSTTDSPQALQAAASPEGQSESDWMVFDKEAADSDKDAIENISIGDFQMREETPEPMSSLAQQDYQLQLRLLEEQNKSASRWLVKSNLSRTQQDYQLQLKLLEKQKKRRLEMARQEQSKLESVASTSNTIQMHEETPEPMSNLAQQDYELQLRLLEEQNKKRLEMARQEQSKRHIQLSQTEIKVKGPPEPIPMAVMGSPQGNPTGGRGNMMAPLPPGAPYFIPTSRPYSVNPMALNVNSMATLGVQPTMVPMPPNPPDPTVLLLQRQLKELQITNQSLRRQLEHAKGDKFVVFHCILGQEGEGTYLGKPYWVNYGGKLQLKADSPVLYPDAYILYKPLEFAIYKYYSTDIPTETRDTLQQDAKMLIPKPQSEVIKLISEEMIASTKAFAKKNEDLRKNFPSLSAKNEIQVPYSWWYHYRDHRNIINDLPKPQAELIHLLTKWIDDSYSELYSRVDSQFRRGMVSAASMSFLIQPNDVLVRRDAEGVEACLATSWLYEKKRSSEIQESLEDPEWTLLSVPWSKKSQWKWEVDAWSYVYNGDFYRMMRKLIINIDAETADTEIPIANLDVFPLRFASRELQETLRRRGKTFWSCRHGSYISYDNKTKTEDSTLGQRYMVDCRTYNNLHLESLLGQDVPRKEDTLTREFKVESAFIQQEEAPLEPDVFLFPRTLIGYDLQRKKWDHLSVDLIREVAWNKKAFSHLVADAEIKEVVQALVTTKLAAERGTSLMQSKGNGLIMLLHGGPGTGKRFTAESVAELAEKPLLPVACGKISTTPKYLESMLHLAKTWGCVVLLEDAEVFLERRSVDDMTQNALISDFIREIESFDGILILTSKSTGLAEFLSHLSSLGENSIDFDDIESHIGELSEQEMNGHQICSAITTARQLAQFQGNTMTIGHLIYAIGITDKFATFSKT
ncbi:hypothetical protein TrVFT333_006155 [Trichoderma virens FT-333]|nr:hypothetical protein TrVFT333_006155 [Trichoderma virens FT-333]